MLFPFSHGIEPNRLAKATAGMSMDDMERFVHENWGEDEPEEDEEGEDDYDDIYDEEDD